jgi:hypothetical protein
VTFFVVKCFDNLENRGAANADAGSGDSYYNDVLRSTNNPTGFDTALLNRELHKLKLPNQELSIRTEVLHSPAEGGVGLGTSIQTDNSSPKMRLYKQIQNVYKHVQIYIISLSLSLSLPLSLLLGDLCKHSYTKPDQHH